MNDLNRHHLSCVSAGIIVRQQEILNFFGAGQYLLALTMMLRLTKKGRDFEETYMDQPP